MVSGKYASKQEKRKHAIEAVNHLLDVGYTKSPYWEELLYTSEIQNVKESENPAEEDALVVQKALAHKYGDAITILETIEVSCKEHYQTLQKIVHLLMLSHNYKELEELDYRINAVPASYESLPPKELDALRRIRLLICSSFYLKGCYFDCCKGFFKLLDSDPDILSTLLKEEQNQFMTNDEILSIVTVSTVLAIPFDNYDDFLYMQNLESFGNTFSALIGFLKLLINTSFSELLGIWHGAYNEKCQRSFFLNQSWSSAKYTMRNKIYFFYLRISHKLGINYLSRTLHVEEESIRCEVEHLIRSAHLNFEIKGDMIAYRPKHYLQDVAPRLKENQSMIRKKIEERASTNQSLKDLVQEIIIKNNEQRLKNSSTNSNGSEILGHGLNRTNHVPGLIDNMDVDEINETSDIESTTFEIGN